MWGALLKLLGVGLKKLVQVGVSKAADKGVEAITVNEKLQGKSGLLSNPEIEKAKEDLTGEKKSVASKLVNLAVGEIGKNVNLNKQPGVVKFAESFGGKTFLNTLMGAAQQGIFSSSDVGQPDRDAGGILANNLLGSAVGALRERSYESDRNRVLTEQQLFDQQLKLMDISKNIDVKHKPLIEKDIQGVQEFITNKLLSKRGFDKGSLNSEDMLEVNGKYEEVANKISGYRQGQELLQKNMAQFTKTQGDPNILKKYDAEEFKNRVYAFEQTGTPPKDGTFLKEAAVDPYAYFGQVKITPSDRWVKGTESIQGYHKVTPYTSMMTDEQRKQFVDAEVMIPGGVRDGAITAWNEFKTTNPNEAVQVLQGVNGDEETAMRYWSRTQFGKLIEPPRVEKDLQMGLYNQANEKPKDLKYQFVDNYPSANGNQPAIVVSGSDRMPKQALESLTGQKINSQPGEAMNVTYEYIDPYGDLWVTANTPAQNQRTAVDQSTFETLPREKTGSVWGEMSVEGGQRKYYRVDKGSSTPTYFSVDKSQAKALMQSKFPGLWEQAQKKGFFQNKPEKAPKKEENYVPPFTKPNLGTIKYEVDGAVYNIPSNEAEDFLKDFPKAKKING